MADFNKIYTKLPELQRVQDNIQTLSSSLKKENTNLQDQITTTSADLSSLTDGYTSHSGNAAIHFTESSINHGNLLGLTGTDHHTQYLLADGSRAVSGNLTVNSHIINTALKTALDGYAVLAGRAGGQTLIGGTAASETLTLQSTANATRGKLLFGTSAYDEVNNRLGLGNTSPSYLLDARSSVRLGNHEINANSMELARLGTGDRDTYLDFWSQGSTSDYDFRVARFQGANGNASLENKGTGNINIWQINAGSIVFGTSGAERARITSAGQFLFGKTTTNSVSSGAIPRIQNHGTDANTGSILLRTSSTTSAPTIHFARSRGGSVSTDGYVNSGDILGYIAFDGYSNAAGGLVRAAAIYSLLDGEPDTAGDTTDMPGALYFATTTEGSGTISSRLAIKNNGQIGIGTTTPATSAALDITSTTGAFLPPRMTTAQRDLLTPTAGMVIFNSSTSKLQVYTTAWTDLH